MSPSPSLAGVVGWPVGHSRSPRLHGFWLNEHDVDGAYIRLPVQPGDLERVLRALPLMGFAGVNLTIPHKEAGFGLVDRVDPVATRIGAVNTIKIEQDGSLSGSNTDAFGFIENLRDGHSGFDAKRGPAVVLGAGGAARAVVAALIDDGCSEVRLINRNQERAEALATHFGAAIVTPAWAERAEALDGAVLLVNTTSLGMRGQPPLDLRLDGLPATALVNDIVFAPLETELLAAAKHRGNPVVDGLGMLLHQGRPGFAAWFGVMPAVTPALRAWMERP